VANKMIRSKEM